MEKILDNKLPAKLVGFYQALIVVVYTGLVGALLFSIEQSKLQPGYLGFVFMLTLFVFSAAITGSAVFGLAAYQALKNNIKQALAILGYTFFFILIDLLILLAVIILLPR